MEDRVRMIVRQALNLLAYDVQQLSYRISDTEKQLGQLMAQPDTFLAQKEKEVRKEILDSFEKQKKEGKPIQRTIEMIANVRNQLGYNLLESKGFVANLEALARDNYPGKKQAGTCPCTRIVQDAEGNTISGLVDQIMGQDGIWYCKSCEPGFYRNVDEHYNGRKD